MHAIGAASLARHGGSVARTFAGGDSSCGSGYYHGVLERSLVNVKSRQPDVLAPVARTLCDETASMTPWIAYQCLHGLGHGLMIATGLNLPISLEVCSRLARWWDRDACRGGVFMENLSTSYGVRSRWLRDEDPVYPCNWVASRGQAALLPDGHHADPSVGRRRLDSHGGDVHARRERVRATCASGRSGATRRVGADAMPPRRSRPARSPGRSGAKPTASLPRRRMSSRNFTSGERGAPAVRGGAPSSLAERCFEGLGSVLGRLRKTAAGPIRGLPCADVERRARRGVHARRPQRAAAFLDRCAPERRR